MICIFIAVLYHRYTSSLFLTIVQREPHQFGMQSVFQAQDRILCKTLLMLQLARLSSDF